jgi:hypothetical protein
MHEVHGPALRGARRERGGAPVQGDVLASADAHPELQAVEPIEPAHPLAIHLPPLAAQEHPDPQVPEPRPRMGELANPQPQGGLIPRPALPIPGGATEVR